ACCAPGGKTCHILEREPELAEVVALDLEPKRLQRVQENLQRLQLKATLTAADARDTQAWWDGKPFQRILLDAPCSATGVIRRHPDIKLARQADDIAPLAILQGVMLDALWPTLEVGGVLLYATCSVLPTENREVIEAFLNRTPGARELDLPDAFGLQQPHGRQLLPQEDGHDGFYYAKLIKIAAQPGAGKRERTSSSFRSDRVKVIILGAGQVGGTLAENLASEANDITVVDTDPDRLRDLGDRLDIRTVVGHASFPTVLRQAGADDADMLVAVTNSDETNVVACQVAFTLFNTPTKIARVRESAYLTRSELFDTDAIPIDVLISPEQAVTNHIKRLIEYPGALQVLDFAEGKAQLVCVRAYYGGPLVGQELRQLRAHMPNVDTRVAAIFRRDRPIFPTGDTIIEVDDEVFFIAARTHIRAVM